MATILNAPNPVLSAKATQIFNVNKEILGVINNMKVALEKASDPVGVGLAAPQIGKSLQIFITKPNLKSKISVFINPKILEIDPVLKTASKKKKIRKLEGCLSLKDIWGEVERNPKITLEYLDEKEKSHKKVFTGFIATIIQHEMDHLDGILFPKRVLEQKGTLYKSVKDEGGQDLFEELKI